MKPESMDTVSFVDKFAALTGHTPFCWQQRLFDRFREGNFPTSINLQTGLGKTSIIPIWLIALAEDAKVPRRLAYIVNRRTVVDQATHVVEQMRERLRNPGNERWNAHQSAIENLGKKLRAHTAIDAENIPFAVSTLRGELADNEEWKADPARAAIVG